MEKWLDDLYELCETVSREIGDANEKIRAAGGKLNAGDVDYLDKLTHMMKSIKTTIAMAEAEDDGESGFYPYMGGYRSYAGGRNGGGMSQRMRSNAQRRDSRGRYSNREDYSRDDARAEMVEDLRELMQDAPDEKTRQKFHRFISEIENA